MKTLPKIPRSRRSFQCAETGGVLVYQSFSMGMASVLLESQLDENVENSLLALEQIAENVLVTEIPVAKLPMYILEKLFVRARSLSMGSEVAINYTCKRQTEENEVCGGKMEVQLDLDTVDVVYPEGFQHRFELEGGYTVEFNVPNIEAFKKLQGMLTEETKAVDPNDIILLFFNRLWNEQEVWERDEFSNEDLLEWAKELDSTIILKVMKDFYGKLPYFGTDLKMECPKCGYRHETTVRGIRGLFQ